MSHTKRLIIPRPRMRVNLSPIRVSTRQGITTAGKATEPIIEQRPATKPHSFMRPMRGRSRWRLPMTGLAKRPSEDFFTFPVIFTWFFPCIQVRQLRLPASAGNRPVTETRRQAVQNLCVTACWTSPWTQGRAVKRHCASVRFRAQCRLSEISKNRRSPARCGNLDPARLAGSRHE